MVISKRLKKIQEEKKKKKKRLDNKRDESRQLREHRPVEVFPQRKSDCRVLKHTDTHKHTILKEKTASTIM